MCLSMTSSRSGCSLPLLPLLALSAACGLASARPDPLLVDIGTMSGNYVTQEDEGGLNPANNVGTVRWINLPGRGTFGFDYVVINNTGVAWGDFHLELYMRPNFFPLPPSVEFGGASTPDAFGGTAGNPASFTIVPLPYPGGSVAGRAAHIANYDAPVPPGGRFNLHIDISQFSSYNPCHVYLHLVPTPVPVPGALALGTLGMMFVVPRRRRGGTSPA